MNKAVACKSWGHRFESCFHFRFSTTKKARLNLINSSFLQKSAKRATCGFSDIPKDSLKTISQDQITFYVKKFGQKLFFISKFSTMQWILAGHNWKKLSSSSSFLCFINNKYNSMKFICTCISFFEIGLYWNMTNVRRG